MSLTHEIWTILGRTADCRVQEYEFYYLQSRYYNPAVGRFLNADALASTGQGILGNNTFSYCQNNPIVFWDQDGYCREIGALLTWIDCGSPDCPTSSLSDPEHYRSGYNHPKYYDSQRYYEEQSKYNDTIFLYPFRDFLAYSRSDEGRRTLKTIQAGYGIIHGASEVVGGVIILWGDPTKVLAATAAAMIIGGLSEVKGNAVEIWLIWGE